MKVASGIYGLILFIACAGAYGVPSTTQPLTREDGALRVFDARTMKTSAALAHEADAASTRPIAVPTVKPARITPAIGAARTTQTAPILPRTGSSAVRTPAMAAVNAAAYPPVPANISAKILSNKLRLNRIFFSPGLVDDDVDGHYRAAVRAFQEANGIEPDGNVGPATSATLGNIGPLLQYFALDKQFFDELCKLPEDYFGKSLVPRLGYETILELTAERFHTSQSFLRQLNPQVNWDSVTPGTTVTVPFIRRRRPNFYAAKVEINIAQKSVRVWDETGKLRAFFNCSIGTDKKVYGGLMLAIANTAEWPTYTLRPELFHLEKEIRNKLLLPEGPNNPVGRAWVGLNRPGYGIHGTPDPEKIGLTESHGCIRLTNWDALSFSFMARVGAGVVFVGAPGGETQAASEAEPTTGTKPAAAPKPAAAAKVTSGTKTGSAAISPARPVPPVEKTQNKP